MGLAEARAALRRARSQLDRVQTATWDPPDRVDAVTWAFYAYENAIVAVAEATGLAWTKSHAEKARLASQLASRGTLSTDISDRLNELNHLRKDVAYGDPGPELEQIDLEDLSSNLEDFLDEVEGVVQGVEDEN